MPRSVENNFSVSMLQIITASKRDEEGWSEGRGSRKYTDLIVRYWILFLLVVMALAAMLLLFPPPFLLPIVVTFVI